MLKYYKLAQWKKQGLDVAHVFGKKLRKKKYFFVDGTSVDDTYEVPESVKERACKRIQNDGHKL